MSSGITINLNIYGADAKAKPEIKMTGAEVEQFSGQENESMEMPPVPVADTTGNSDLHIPPFPPNAFTTTGSNTENNIDPGVPPFSEQEENTLSNTNFVAPPEMASEDTSEEGLTFTAPGMPQGVMDEPETITSQPSFPPDAAFVNGTNEEDNYPAPPEPE